MRELPELPTMSEYAMAKRELENDVECLCPTCKYWRTYGNHSESNSGCVFDHTHSIRCKINDYELWKSSHGAEFITANEMEVK